MRTTHWLFGEPKDKTCVALARLGDRGSVVVYHKDFECKRLEELSQLFPELAA